MDALTRQDLEILIEAQDEWCVSMFMPMVRAGAEVQQNTIRFKNLLRQAEERLEKLDMRAPDIKALLAPAQGLLDDPTVWRTKSDGLAVFAGPGVLEWFRLPITFKELVVVERRFHVKPVLPLLSGDGQFYVLALSQDQIRLLVGSRDSISEIDLEGVPESLAEALQYDTPQRQLRAVGGSGGTVYHGSGGEEEEKLDILRYFQRVDRGLRDLLADQQPPLLLAGVDYLLPIYHEASAYPHLLDEGLTGNPQALSAKELHRRAWAVIKPHFEQAQQEQRALYAELAGRDDPRASNTVQTIVKAAHEGRVATLFVAFGVQQWGVYRAHSHNVHVHPDRQPGDQDLLDISAARTFANGGAVYVVDHDQIPGGKAMAAIFRY